MNRKPTYCADVIARYGDATGPLILIERLGSQKGLAFPGGKQDPGETLSQTAVREFREETGLELVASGILNTRAESGRDPRGDYVSTVFVGIATGVVREEARKTRVLFLTETEAVERKAQFAFDHFAMLSDYLGLT